MKKIDFIGLLLFVISVKSVSPGQGTHSYGPVFRQYRRVASLQDVLESSDARMTTAVTLTECVASCKEENLCKAVFYGSLDNTCYHRENALFTATGDYVKGYDYYYATGKTSSAPSYPPYKTTTDDYFDEFPTTAAYTPNTNLTIFSNSTSSSSTKDSCSVLEGVYFQQLGLCVFAHELFVFNWATAQQMCEAAGGNLIEFENITKYEVVKDYLAGSASILRPNDGFWTGAYSVTELQYEWSSGVPVAQSMWDYGEPKWKEECAYMKKPNFELSTLTCDSRLDMLCEIN